MKDINPDPVGPEAVTLADVVYFVNSDPLTGYELWRTDGTTAGTSIVKDIFPGRGSAAPTSLTPIGNTLYFAANDGVRGVELWKTDGTAAGTVLVRDIRTGPESSSPVAMTDAAGVLMFSANDGMTGQELWRSDGTLAGTTIIKNIAPGAESSAPRELVAAADGLVYFTAWDFGTTYVEPDRTSGQLWRTDGTAAGTFILSALTCSEPTPLGNRLLFSAYDKSGSELWISDGTEAGTVLFVDIGPGSASSNPTNFVVVGERAFFTARTDATGDELWVTDGTPGGTVMVKEIRPGTESTWFYDQVVLDGRLFFIAHGGNGFNLWTSDATESGTYQVKELPGLPDMLTAAGGGLYFHTDDRLWKSDGTAAGTAVIGGPWWGPSVTDGIIAMAGGPTSLTSAKVLAFTASGELWASNGTVAGTKKVADVEPPTRGTLVDGFTTYNNRVYFFTRTTYGALWASDGTLDGTVFIRGAASFSATMTVSGGWLYFTSYGDLWRTDGTSSGMSLVAPDGGSGYPSGLTDFNGTLYFVRADAAGGQELWKTDGTVAGTVLVKDINPGTAGSKPANFKVVGSNLYFSADDGVNGVELWKTDGTAAGTVLVKDVNPGAASSSPSRISDIGGGLVLFSATTATAGMELWKTDGTAAGTALVKDINPGAASGFNSYDADYAVSGGYLYFGADNGSVGRELWRSNGTAAGTTLVKNINSYGGAAIMDMFAAGGTVYFGAWGDVGEVTLWKTNGTSAGTVSVRSWNPATSPDHPRGYLAVGSTIYFIASDTVHGTELWRTNGTAAGTVVHRDVMPGIWDSNRYYGAVGSIGNQLFYAGGGWTTGDELYASGPPTALLDDTVTLPEHGVAELDGSLSYALDPWDVLTYAWDLDGDGVFGETGTAAARGGETGIRPMISTAGLGRGETITVGLRVTDSNGLSSSTSATLILVNQAPVPSIHTPATPITEGSVVLLSGDVGDAPDDVAAGFTTWWEVTYRGMVYAGGSGPSFSFSGVDDGTYDVTFFAWDQEGLMGTATAVVTVASAAPTAAFPGLNTTVGAPTAVSLGVPFDPSPTDTSAGFWYSFDLDDDGVFEVADSRSPSTTVTFGAAGLRTIRAMIRDKDGAATTYTATVTVVLPPPPGAQFHAGGSVPEGSAGSVGFSGVTGVAPLSYSYDFDDDGVFEVVDTSATSATVPASFLVDGPFDRTVRARITDQFGRSSSFWATIPVLNVPPVLAIPAAAGATLPLGQTYSLSVGAADVGPDQVTSWHIAWGDHTNSVLNAVGGIVTHDYLTPGFYTVTLTAHDEDGSYSETRSLTVVASPPTATLMKGGPIKASVGHRFMVRYVDDLGVDPSTVGEDDVQVSGPSGGARVRFVSVTAEDGERSLVATYEVQPVAGVWSWQDNGVYSVSVRPDAVKDAQGLPVAAGEIGTFAVSLEIPQAGDVVPAFLGALPKTLSPGEKRTVTVRMSNRGVKAIPPAAMTTRLYLSADPVLDESDVVLGSVTRRKGLPLNGADLVMFPLTTPKVAVTGKYYLLTRADAGDAVLERDERNNVVASGPVTIVAPSADLSMVLTGKLKSAWKAGEKLAFGMKVTNGGPSEAVGAGVLKAYFSTNPVLDASDQLVLTSNLALKLKAKGASAVFNRSVKIPAGLGKGRVYMLLALDASTVGDRNAANNRLVIPLQVG